MMISDPSMIKAIEIHTIMGSNGYVLIDDRTRIFSTSPNHASVLSISDYGGYGLYGDRFFVTSGGGYNSPYWKAKKWIKLYEEDGNLIVSTDYGVGSMEPVDKVPMLPEPPSSLKSVDVHRVKVELSKMLGTRNYKRPRVVQKYVNLDSVFRRLGRGYMVKSSTLLQALEISWRVNKRGKIGISENMLYFLVSNGSYDYEAFILLL